MSTWAAWMLLVVGLLVAAWQFRAAVLDLGGLIALGARIRDYRREVAQLHQEWGRERHLWGQKRKQARDELLKLQVEHQQALDLVAAYAKVPLSPDRIRRVQELLTSDFGDLDDGPGARPLPAETVDQV